MSEGVESASNGRLGGTVAIVTGAASGMGAAIARKFVEAGASVVLADRNPAGERLAAELGAAARFQLLDVASESQWDDACSTALAAFGKLTALVNCAGIFIPLPMLETDREQFARSVDVNQLGVFLGMKAAAPLIADAGGGSIVNISSGVALRGIAGMFAYSASKWAVRGMTRCAALELAKHGIRVNGIYPGAIDTPMIQLNPAGFNDAIVATMPLARMGTPDEIADAVTFLTSAEAAYITGAELPVDGGGAI
ncbi:putative short-chain dehydrogenase/reductase [Sphingobium sp. TA15]|uniref:LinC-like SDR-family protein n=1 Tax=Sphingobium indicum (strain DSM 16413 / CCM 7287 / MTCC 6362 / UT26 / NBRC 101211 / UT26S) TaxID=452662 RepID=D4Z8B3_SPHIU|nr:glucose 1-dehydrogenase [Sphingobium indicum]BAI98732.1 LinC-like SDR-family protein [Sphingobium indicum UT26S]BDD68782.1 putative short-chain dehydrogenase/reductase [Sphingobium sp. TA15]